MKRTESKEMKGIFLQIMQESVPESLWSVEAVKAEFWCAPWVRQCLPYLVPCCPHFPRGWLSFPFPSHCGQEDVVPLSWKEENVTFPPSVFSGFNVHGRYGRKAGAGWGVEVDMGLPWDAEVAHGAMPSARSFAEGEWGSPSLRRQENSLPWKLLDHKGWSVQKCFQSRAVCGATSALTLFSRRGWWMWPCGRESRKGPRDWGKSFRDLQGISSEVSSSWSNVFLPRSGLTAPSLWTPASGLMPVSLCLLDLTCSAGWSSQPMAVLEDKGVGFACPI